MATSKELEVVPEDSQDNFVIPLNYDPDQEMVEQENGPRLRRRITNHFANSGGVTSGSFYINAQFGSEIVRVYFNPLTGTTYYNQYKKRNVETNSGPLVSYSDDFGLTFKGRWRKRQYRIPGSPNFDNLLFLDFLAYSDTKTPKAAFVGMGFPPNDTKNKSKKTFMEIFCDAFLIVKPKHKAPDGSDRPFLHSFAISFIKNREQIIFGGPREEAYKAPVAVVPILKAQKSYVATLSAIAVGTIASKISLSQKKMVFDFNRKLLFPQADYDALGFTSQIADNFQVDCKTVFPNIIYKFEGSNETFTIHPTAYIVKKGTSCFANIGVSPTNYAVAGNPFHREYYTYYDQETYTITIAPYNLPHCKDKWC